MTTRRNPADEMEFFRDVLSLVDKAKELRARADREGFHVPDSLLAFLGEDRSDAAERIEIPMLRPPADAPKNMPAGWIWVSALNPNTLVRTIARAVLRASGKMPLRMLVDAVQRYRPDLNEGSLANAGSAMESDRILRRDSSGWELTEEGVAGTPMLVGKFLYGPPELFASQEVAWFRREAICDLLQKVPDGLQPMQIVRHLEPMDWIPGNKSKDIIKPDIEFLIREKRVKRSGASGKLFLVDKIDREGR